MQAESRARTHDWSRTVFRLSGIPSGATTYDAVAALVAKALDIRANNVQVYSLATTLNPWETPPSSIATLMLRQSPVLLASSKDGRNQWTLNPGSGHDNLLLDTHFWGVTPLNDVAPEKHIADCVAISGLASHAFGSWQPRGDDKTFMWIRDEALKYVPGIRAILYGYDSTLVDSKSFQRIDHLALSLIAKLGANGGTLSDAKPLVFLAHSLGGIVLKEALCRLANSQDNSLERKTFSRCKGAIMFGVPNLGMEQDHLLAIVRGSPPENLVQDLSRESGSYGYLNRLEESFSGVVKLGGMTFHWVFETSKSPTFNPETGKMTGPDAILVDPDSATSHRVKSKTSASSVHPIHRNHSEMVKFTRGDPNLGPIIELLRRVCGLPGNESVGKNIEMLGTATSSPSGVRADAGVVEPRETIAQKRKRLYSDLMESLDSPGLDFRQESITTRFEHTCEWLYQYEPFTSWLQRDDSLFWIHGKPGSGKSTLMKFMYANERISQYSYRFGSSRCYISAGFFFNYRGTTIEKTLEGLMRSIVRQIIDKLLESSVTIPLLDALMQSPAFAHQCQDSWSKSRLEEALKAILEQREAELQITFFLDALDEFDGPPDYISRFVKYLASRPSGSLTYTKVSFSSRPWENFISNFGEGPRLCVEDQTKEDIRYFCRTSLFDTLEANHHHFVPRLADEIILRAAGVFLWTSLVLNELLAAFSDGKTPSMEDLLQLLDTLPLELSEFYRFIIQRIPRHLQWRTFALLEAVVRAHTIPELQIGYLWRTVMISDSPNYRAAQHTLDDSKGSSSSDEDMEKEASRAILLWGGGLVSIAHFTTQLMHQTVFEFVTQLDFKDQVLGPMSKATHENGHSFHWKSVLSLSFVDWTNAIHDQGSDILDHGAKAEETTGRSCQPFLDSVPSSTIATMGAHILTRLDEKAAISLSEFFKRDSSLIKSHLAFATFFRLRLYLRDHVKTNPDSVRKIAESEDLVQLVVIAIGLGYTDGSQQLVSAARFLLENGHDRSSIWTLFPYVLNPIFRRNGMSKAAWPFDPIRRLSCFQAYEQLAVVFLEYNTRCTSRQIPLGEDPACWAMPMHVAPPAATRWLLEHGGDPNQLDFAGRTPLDYASGARPLNLTIGNGLAGTIGHLPLYQVVSALLQHGGKLRRTSVKQWEDFVQIMRDKCFDVSSFPTSPPRIPIEDASPPASESKSSLSAKLKRLLTKRHRK